MERRALLTRGCAPPVSWIALALALGCVSHETATLPPAGDAAVEFPRGASVEQDGVSLRLAPFFEKAVAAKYLALDPIEARVLPVYLEVSNTGSHPIRVDLPASVLLTDRGREVRWLPFDQAVEVARPAEWSTIALPLVVPFALAGGLVGIGTMYAVGIPTGSVNQDVDRDFFAKAFRPSVIRPGGTAAGIVFYSAMGYQQKVLTEAVLPVADLSSGRVTKVRLQLPARAEGAAAGAVR